MDNQQAIQQEVGDNPTFQFISDEDVQSAQAPQEEAQPVIEQLQQEEDETVRTLTEFSQLSLRRCTIFHRHHALSRLSRRPINFEQTRVS